MCEILQLGKCKGKHDLEKQCPEVCRYIESTLAGLNRVYETYLSDDLQEEKAAYLE